ncbi:MAG: tetratricopeptide repeat protein [Bacteroidales bacterium]|jgi:tetratricopeptide (TPR) repeat protein|nr:hypothetical protein [Bacteroidales bacterium]
MQGQKKPQKKYPLSPKTSPLKVAKAQRRMLHLSPANWQYVILCFLSLLIYSNTLFFDYALDDGLIITDNKSTKKGFEGLGEIFTKNSFYGVFGDEANELLPGGRYRPLAQATFAVEYEVFDKNPFVSHLLNILLYAFICMLLLKVLRNIFEKYENEKWYLSVPFIASLLFACHPLHTEVVANIKGRDELLSLAGSLASLHFSLQYIKTLKPLNLFFSFLVFSLALLSKENAVTFLAIIPFSVFLIQKTSFKKYIFIVLPLLTSVAVYFLLRVNALGFISNTVENNELLNNPFLQATTSEKYATIFYTWGKYLLLILFPFSLTHDYYPYHISLTTFSDFRVIISMFIYITMIIYCIIRIWEKDIIAFALLIFLATFSISSNLLINIGTFMNERFMFVPLLGFAIFVAYIVHRFLSKSKFATVAKVILIIILAFYSVRIFSRNFAWRNSFTLLTTDVKTSVNSAKVNVGAGEVLIKSVNDNTPDSVKQRVIGQAIKYLQKGVEIYPGFKAGWVYMGYGQHLTGDYKNSRNSLEQALKLNPKDANAISYLHADALTCYNLGNFRQSEENFKTLIHFVPENTEFKYLLAELYANTGKADTAEIILHEIIKNNPGYDRAYNKLGEIYGRIYGNFSKSFEYLYKAYELNPAHLETLRNLGTAHGLRGEYNQSLKFFLEAEKIKPDDKDILKKLSITYRNLGDNQKAMEYEQKASE